MRTSILFFYNLVRGCLPETKCFKLKNLILQIAGVKIGANVRICSSSKIIGAGQLTIGDNTWIGPECFISSSSNVTIGKNVNIAPRVTIVTGTHEIDLTGASVAGKGYNEDIIIGDGCWICTNSTLLYGTSLGIKNIIAAGAVVKGSFDGNMIIGGIPAKVIKKIIY